MRTALLPRSDLKWSAVERLFEVLADAGAVAGRARCAAVGQSGRGVAGNRPSHRDAAVVAGLRALAAGALRDGERAEVRYAVRHPDIGTRWLLTRVEPAASTSGQRTTSVVTLDVTEQQLARAHR
jgi:hypothetical protein